MEFLQIPNPNISSFTIFSILIVFNKANPIENESFSGGAPGRARSANLFCALSAQRHTRTMLLDSIFSAGSAFVFCTMSACQFCSLLPI